jgi:hypothetical protein
MKAPKKVNCVDCKHMGEFYRYKTRREDGNDCIEMRCAHPNRKGNKYGLDIICMYREYGGLRSGRDAQIKTRPKWCPIYK